MFDQKRVKKYILWYISLLLFFILWLKTMGGGYRNSGHTDPYSWQEIAVIWPKYAIATAVLMVFLIYVDYQDYKKNKK